MCCLIKVSQFTWGTWGWGALGRVVSVRLMEGLEIKVNPMEVSHVSRTSLQ